MNYMCEIVHFCERINWGNYSLFRVFWDLIKQGFANLTRENKLRHLRTLCESNFNLLFFKNEIGGMVQEAIDQDRGTQEDAEEAGWSFEAEGVIKRSPDLAFDLRTELFNTVYASR